MDSIISIISLKSVNAENMKCVADEIKRCSKNDIHDLLQLLRDGDSLADTFNNFIHLTLQTMDVAEFTNREFDKYEESDFVGVAKNFVIFMDALLIILSRLVECESFDESKTAVKCLYESNDGYFLLVLLSHSQTNAWTSNASLDVSKQLKQFLVDLYGLSSFNELLFVTKSDIQHSGYAHLLKIVHSRCTKDRWKRNPTIICVYTQSLFACTFPKLSDYLDKVIPPSLMMIDDYEAANKVKAVKCLHHIMNNVTATELLWQGRINVICDALKHCILLQKEKLSQHAIPCILTTLAILEKNVKRYNTTDHCPHHHEVLGVLLKEAEMESCWEMRRIYSLNLPTFIKRMGLHVLRHSSALMNVTRNYLEIPDLQRETTRLRTLDMIVTFIEECWPRVPHHCETLLQYLLKLLHELCVGDRVGSTSNEELVEKTVVCLSRLRGCCMDTCDKTLSSVIDLKLNDKMNDCISKVINV